MTTVDDTATSAIPATGGETPEDDPEAGARPTALLPMTQLLRISAYWLGLTAIDAAVGLFITNRLEFDHLVPTDDVGTSMFLIAAIGAIVGIIIQPTVGYISDYTVSRWGRRKPYIVFGSLLDVVFLLGIATGSSVLMLAAFVLLLSVSTNIARGPFQGYVPDLVAEPQVGMASGMVGLMQVAGQRDRVPAGVAVGRPRRHAALARGRGARRAGDDGQRGPEGRQGHAAQATPRQVLDDASPARPGRPTSSGSGPTSGCSCPGCCS